MSRSKRLLLGALAFAAFVLACAPTTPVATRLPTASPSAPPATGTTLPPQPLTSVGETGALPKDCREQKIAREATGGKTTGYLDLPEKGTAPFPAVVAIHGGFANEPTDADRTTRGVGRNFASHLCPLGWAVFSVDYRWSVFGMEEMEEVAGAYDYLTTRSDIDKKRIVVMGGSHGGYMTMMAVTSAKYKRPFAAAINLYGFVDIADLVNSAREKNNPQAKLTIEKLGTPETNPSAYREISPRYHIDQLTVPLLIVVGTQDQFLHQLRPFSQDLKKAGKDYEYHEVDDAPHGFEQGHEPYTTILWNYVSAFLKRRV
jgi:dipeptidyl aminopeptidase/acylaminoacyl peptidase